MAAWMWVLVFLSVRGEIEEKKNKRDGESFEGGGASKFFCDPSLAFRRFAPSNVFCFVLNSLSLNQNRFYRFRPRSA